MIRITQKKKMVLKVVVVTAIGKGKEGADRSKGVSLHVVVPLQQLVLRLQVLVPATPGWFAEVVVP